MVRRTTPKVLRREDIVPLIVEGNIILQDTEVRPSQEGKWRLALLCRTSADHTVLCLSRGPFASPELALAAKDELLSQCAQRRH